MMRPIRVIRALKMLGLGFGFREYFYTCALAVASPAQARDDSELSLGMTDGCRQMATRARPSRHRIVISS
jgi:hypothetical protein